MGFRVTLRRRVVRTRVRVDPLNAAGRAGGQSHLGKQAHLAAHFLTVVLGQAVTLRALLALVVGPGARDGDQVGVLGPDTRR